LPEIVGKNKNSKTLLNFFFDKIINNSKFLLYKNVKRNILDVDDAIKASLKIIKINKNRNKTINILNKTFYSPENIIKNFEKILLTKAKFKIKFIKQNKLTLKNNYFIRTNKDYLKKILKKYYLK
jgi:nucleoside-diphosphate-sugar epimerase